MFFLWNNRAFYSHLKRRTLVLIVGYLNNHAKVFALLMRCGSKCDMRGALGAPIHMHGRRTCCFYCYKRPVQNFPCAFSVFGSCVFLKAQMVSSVMGKLAALSLLLLALSSSPISGNTNGVNSRQFNSTLNSWCFGLDSTHPDSSHGARFQHLNLCLFFRQTAQRRGAHHFQSRWRLQM